MSDRKRWALPRPLGRAVERELARLGPAAQPLEVGRRWAEAVGPTVARHSWPANVKPDGTLVVHTSSSVWAHELTQLAGEIRARLGPDAPPALQFRLGPIPDPAPVSPTEEHGSPAEPFQATPSERREASRIAAEIDDPALRDTAARAIAAALARLRSARPI